MQRDPIGLWGDAVNFGSAFAFVGCMPGNRLDPFGLHDVNFIPTTSAGLAELGFNKVEIEFYTNKDVKLAQWIDKAPLRSDELSVAAHGSKAGVVKDSLRNDISPKKMADIIRATDKFKKNPNVEVVLTVCYAGYAATGNAADTFAQKLADELGTSVVAATYLVDFYEGGYKCVREKQNYWDGRHWMRYHPKRQDGVVAPFDVYDEKNGKWVRGLPDHVKGRDTDHLVR